MRYIYLILITLVAQVSYGQTGWFPLNSGVQVALWDVAFFSSDSGIVVGGYATALRTENGGLTWTRIHLPVDSTTRLGRIALVGSQVIHIIGYIPISSTDFQTVILKSTDRGNTWNRYQPDTL